MPDSLCHTPDGSRHHDGGDSPGRRRSGRDCPDRLAESGAVIRRTAGSACRGSARRNGAFLRAGFWRLLTLVGLLIAAPAACALEDVPYVNTPEPVVDAILDLAGVGPGDYLIDLGSGDGRIVIAAARRFGIRAKGVEIDPALVERSRQRAADAGVAHLTEFVTQDLFETDLSKATVVTLYLLPDVNLALRPRLQAALAPGSRIVSHDWDMGDWPALKSVEVDAPGKTVGMRKRSVLWLWVVGKT